MMVEALVIALTDIKAFEKEIYKNYNFSGSLRYLHMYLPKHFDYTLP